jgi:hypothetical protein
MEDLDTLLEQYPGSYVGWERSGMSFTMDRVEPSSIMRTYTVFAVTNPIAHAGFTISKPFTDISKLERGRMAINAFPTENGFIDLELSRAFPEINPIDELKFVAHQIKVFLTALVTPNLDSGRYIQRISNQFINEIDELPEILKNSGINISPSVLYNQLGLPFYLNAIFSLPVREIRNLQED